MIVKLSLSITSFIPLYLFNIFMYLYSFFYINLTNYQRYSILIIVVIILLLELISIIILNLYINNKVSLKVCENQVRFKNIYVDKTAHVNYMLTYLLPLLIYDFDNFNLFYVVLMNIFIMFFIYMNAIADNFNFNIVIWIKGYRIYRGVDINGYERTLLIDKNKFSNIKSINEEYRFVTLAGSSDIYLCKDYRD